jgi:hypothetical protein
MQWLIKKRERDEAYISTSTLSRVMTFCRPMGLIWILTSTCRRLSVHTFTYARPGSTDY